MSRMRVGSLVKIIGTRRNSKNSNDCIPVTVGWPGPNFDAINCITLVPGLLCIVINVAKKEKIVRVMIPDGQLLYTTLNEVTLA